MLAKLAIRWHFQSSRCARAKRRSRPALGLNSHCESACHFLIACDVSKACQSQQEFYLPIDRKIASVPKASPQKSSQKPRSLKQREGPSFNRRHGKELRAKEAAKQKKRQAKPARGMSAAAQKHPPLRDAGFSTPSRHAATPVEMTPRTMRPQQENA